MTDSYLIIARSSRFKVQAFATGRLSVFGHSPSIAIREFTGEVQFDPDAPEKSTLKAKADLASLELMDDIKERDAVELMRTMHSDVLQSDQFPEVAYECSRPATGFSKTGEGLYSLTLNGDMTLHGVTRPQPIPATASLSGDTLRCNGDFPLLQTDFGIQLIKVAGGMLTLKDELKFSFGFLCRKQG